MGVVAAAAVALLAYAFMPQPVLIDMATVQRRDVRVTVDEDGRTRIKERYLISAPLSGRLMRIQLDPGDNVHGQQTLLAAIEPRDPELLDPRAGAEAAARVNAAKATLDQAEPEVERAEALLDQAKRDHERLEKLRASGSSNQREVDDAATLVRVRQQEATAASFARQVAKFQLDLAEAAQLRTKPGGGDGEHRFEIRAPCDGRVLRVFQESEGVVAPGTPLLEFGDPQNLEAVIDVLSVDAVKIRPGNPVVVEQWGGPHPLQGVVRTVEPAAFTKVSSLGVEEQRVNIIIDFVDPPADRPGLGDGYHIDARIVIDQRPNVLTVPVSALFRDGDRWAVFAVVDGRAALRDVEIGARTADIAEVTSGVNEGDVVIAHPSDQVAEGVRVEKR